MKRQTEGWLLSEEEATGSEISQALKKLLAFVSAFQVALLVTIKAKANAWQERCSSFQRQNVLFFTLVAFNRILVLSQL